MTLSNLAPVVNDYEAIKDQIDLLTERLDALKAIIRDSGADLIVGDTAVIKVSLAERSTLDANAVRALISEADYAACVRVTVYPVIKLARKKTA